MITQENIKELFYYKEGELYWKENRGRNKTKFKIAGTKRPDGYIKISFSGKSYLAHRLIFLFHHGYMSDFVDHIDRNKSNNKIENLRECTRSQNMMNAKTPKDNASGVKGLSYNDASINPWHVQINLNNEHILNEYFNTKQEAIEVLREAREKYHGEFTNHG